MPLKPGKTKATISHNIEAETDAGKPHDQAVAIALHTAHPNEKGYSDGGIVDSIKQHLMKIYGSDKTQNGDPAMSPTLGDETHGLQGLVNRIQTEKNDAQKANEIEPVVPAQGYADGGVVGDDDFLSKLQAGTAMSDQPPVQFNPQVGLPPVPPPPSVPAATPSPISAYLGQQKQQIGKYGPEQQLAVSNDILGRQNSIQGRLANAGTGLADALMQGVARAGPSNFQANLQNRQNAQGQQQLEALKGAREGNIQNVEAGQKLDTMDPNSAISKATQASQGLTLAALGFEPKTIGQMSAAEIPAAINTLKDLGLKEREIMVAKFKAQIEANQLAETSQHNRADEAAKRQELGETAKQHTQENAIKGEEIQSGQLEKAASLPLTSRIAAALGGNPAQKELQHQALAGSSQAPHQVTSQIEYDALPPGSHYTDSTGHLKIKGNR